MDLRLLIKRAEKVKEKYEELNRIKGKKPWTVSEYVQGLVGDVGDLVKLIMIKRNFLDKNTKEINKKIRHELADCFWSLMIIAQELDIDLEEEFLINMEYIKQKLSEEIEEL